MKVIGGRYFHNLQDDERERILSPDGPLTHFASPRGKQCRLKARLDVV
ncbi:MAG: hypothetical protein OXH92_17305 [Bryobacterales bacterium]|nr:hypothetical protein [Bryobacterales bacterium]